jgi:glycoside/pentoside/hexuronide:cation symporter, GPH family
MPDPADRMNTPPGKTAAQPEPCTRARMISYSIGESANSLIMNSLFGFAMLYYTDALGLRHSEAGLAMALAVFWDAITDPVMGHITDNTRSRFGRRHPYILLGGLATVATYVFLWYVPEAFRADARLLFWYLVGINLLQRTAITVFYIPYTALGFEMCTDYRGRVTLQGIRSAMNMLANLLGPGLAWAIFFANNDRVRATSVPENYLLMGLSFAAVSLLCILAVVVLTRRYITDSRRITVEGETIGAFVRNMREILSDVYSRYAFLFIVVVTVGIALVSSLQMYLYEHFMRLGGTEKSITHGGSMVGFGVGALVASLLTKRLEKVRTVSLAVFLSVSCNAILAILFLPGLLVPGQSASFLSWSIPYGFIIFALFHGVYWLGNGVMFPTATSMMADVSEINEIRTGVNKDGAYAAVFSFSQKCAISLGVLLSGHILSLIGFEPGREIAQSSGTVWRLCAVTLLAGPAISLLSLGLIRLYPVTGRLLEDLRAGRVAGTGRSSSSVDAEME